MVTDATLEAGLLKTYRGLVGLLLVVALVAGLPACKSPVGGPVAGPAPGPAPPPDKPKVAEKADVQESLAALTEELASILKTLEDLDLVDEADLVP